MGVVGRLPRCYILLTVYFLQGASGTYLAQAASEGKKQSKEETACAGDFKRSCWSEAVEANCSPTQFASRFTLANDFQARPLVVSLYNQRCKKQQEPRVLCQLWGTFLTGEMVDRNEGSFSLLESSTEARTEQRFETSSEEGQTTRQNRPFGALWYRDGSGFYNHGDTVGHLYPSQSGADGYSRTTSSRCRRLRSPCIGGKPGDHGEVGENSRSLSSQRYSGHRTLGELGCSSGLCSWPSSNTQGYSQNPEPATKGRSCEGQLQEPDCSFGSTVEGMDSTSANQTRSAEDPLPTEEEQSAEAVWREARASATIERRVPQGSSGDGETRRDRTFRPYYGRSATPVLRPGDPRQSGGREGRTPGSYQTCSGRWSDESSITKTATTQVLKKHVGFATSVTTHLYVEDVPGNDVTFDLRLDEIPKWSLKPWALYPGTFASTCLQRLLRLRDVPQVPGGGLHRAEGERERPDLHRLLRLRDDPRVPGGDLYRPEEEGDRALAFLDELYGLILGEGGALRQLPAEDLLHDFGINTGNGEITVLSHGLGDVHLGQRSGRIGREGSALDLVRRLVHLIAQLWPEFQTYARHIHIVWPQPDAMGLHLLVVFLDMSHQRIPCLPTLVKKTCWAGSTNTASLEAHWIRIPAARHTVIFDVGLAHHCSTRLNQDCLVRLGNELLITDQPQPLRAGRLIWISFEDTGDSNFVSQPAQHPDEEGQPDPGPHGGAAPSSGSRPSTSATNFNAFGAPASTLGHTAVPHDDDGEPQQEEQDPILAHLFRRGTDWKVEYVQEGSPSFMRRQFAQIWQIDVTEVIGIHPLQAKPKDIPPEELALIVRMDSDSDHRVFLTDVLAMWDIEVHSGINEQPMTFRFVDWTRPRLSRLELLASVHLLYYCREVLADACLVWYNNVLWASQDTDARPIQMGSYIRIAVPPHGARTIAQQTQHLRDLDRAAYSDLYELPAPTSDESMLSGDRSDACDLSWAEPTTPTPPEPEPETDGIQEALNGEATRGQAVTWTCVHCIGADGLPQGWRRLSYWEPDAIHDAAQKLWPEYPDWHLTCASPHADTSGRMHLLWHPLATKQATLYDICYYYKDGVFSDSFKLAGYILDNPTPHEILSSLGLSEGSGGDITLDGSTLYIELQDTWDALQHQRAFPPDGMRTPRSKSDLFQPTRIIPLAIADLLSDTFQPISCRTRTANSDAFDILDFRPVVSLLDWLDCTAPIPSWILPPDCTWHDSSVPWADLSWWDLDVADELLFYTDGSVTTQGAGAAVALFVRCGTDWLFGGFLAQQVTRHCPHFAELAAIAMGQHWLNQILKERHLLGHPCPQVTFAFDSTSAGYKAFGSWGNQCYVPFVNNLRSIEHYLKARFAIEIWPCHVYAHCNEPGNEMANTLAQLGAQGYFGSSTSTWANYISTTVDTEIHWLHALWKPEWTDLWRGALLYLPKKPQSRPGPDLQAFGEVEGQVAAGTGTSPVSLTCTFATANVLSL